MGEVDYKPLISVIVPVYKVEPYLCTCIDSILAQTYTNLEIILVDDGSPDNCPAICDAYAQKDARIKVIHKENGGLSDARNAGLEVCNGEYVAFIDSDDTVNTDWLAELFLAIQRTNVDFVIGGLTYVNSMEKHSVIPETESLTNLVKCSLLGYAWNKLYKREAIDNICFIKVPREDIVYNLSVLSAGKSYAVVPIAGYNYYQHQNSILHSSTVPDITCVLDFEKNILRSIERISEPDRIIIYNDIMYSFITDYLYKMIISHDFSKTEIKQRIKIIIGLSSLDMYLKKEYADNTLYRILYLGIKMKAAMVVEYGFKLCQIL